MDAIFDKLWGVFVGLGWWMLNRLTSKIDALERDKADNSAVLTNSKLINEMDKRMDGIQHTTVPRQEYKSDIANLHSRANELERSKENKVTDIRIVDSDKNKKGK